MCLFNLLAWEILLPASVSLVYRRRGDTCLAIAYRRWLTGFIAEIRAVVEICRLSENRIRCEVTFILLSC